jgi:hypothetical protein
VSANGTSATFRNREWMTAFGPKPEVGSSYSGGNLLKVKQAAI